MELISTRSTNFSVRAAKDLELVTAAKNGCQRSYSILLDRYKSPVYRTMYSMVKNSQDAEDLTIEAFGKAFVKLATYAPHSSFSTWLFTIAKNNCIDHIRKKRLFTLSIDEFVEAGSDLDFSSNLKSNMLDPEEIIIREQRLDLVRDLVNELGEKYRRMIELRYYEEYAYDEIALELNIPLGTVKAQLHRAKDLLYEKAQRPSAKAYLDRTQRKKRKKKVATKPPKAQPRVSEIAVCRPVLVAAEKEQELELAAA